MTEKTEAVRRRFDDGTYPDGFWKWLDRNWHVYDGFVELAHRAVGRNVRRWSARAILNVLRWETALREQSDAAVLKVNDHCTPGLARLAMELEPSLRGFFSTRVSAGKREARRLASGGLYASDGGA